MREKLKPCHRCGTPAEEREDSYGNRVAYCPLTRCSFFNQQDYVEEWNTRPIEDALRADLSAKDELIKRLDDLVEAVDARDAVGGHQELFASEEEWRGALGLAIAAVNTTRARVAEVREAAQLSRESLN